MSHSQPFADTDLFSPEIMALMKDRASGKDAEGADQEDEADTSGTSTSFNIANN
ncbi:MAG: hypothetical protein Q4G30_01150 [Actinomycetaceae bacterium]|nr:hypothetical protein [Actinomycetaceae bacterium]